MNIIAISYKENYDDYCRGCVMDRFSSNFEITSGPEDDVLLKLAQLEENLDRADTSYEHYFLIDGCIVGQHGEFHSTTSIDYDSEQYEKIQDRKEELFDKLATLRADAKRIKEEDEKRKRDEEFRKAQEQTRRNDLRMLTALKEKYPDHV